MSSLAYLIISVFLIHMKLFHLWYQVFSFLDHINLCRAAIVCRQWRAASAHEDFWRCLNFENRKISMEQCRFVCLLVNFFANFFHNFQSS